MKDFFNKSSIASITSFFFVITFSVGLIIGLSAYAEARGIDITGAIGFWLSGK